MCFKCKSSYHQITKNQKLKYIHNTLVAKHSNYKKNDRFTRHHQRYLLWFQEDKRIIYDLKLTFKKWLCRCKTMVYDDCACVGV